MFSFVGLSYGGGINIVGQTIPAGGFEPMFVCGAHGLDMVLRISPADHRSGGPWAKNSYAELPHSWTSRRTPDETQSEEQNYV